MSQTLGSPLTRLCLKTGLGSLIGLIHAEWMPTQKHSIEFKISVARQVIESAKSQAEVSRETNVAMGNIHKWIALARAGRLGSYKVPAFDERTGDLAGEVRRLERELEQVRQERDFFKKVSAFFAKETK